MAAISSNKSTSEYDTTELEPSPNESVVEMTF